MGLEIERKFLVNTEKLPSLKDGHRIRQGYLSSKPCVRIRLLTAADMHWGYITIKGAGTIVRAEYEYAIPPPDAKELLALCKGLITKTRRYFHGQKHVWEIDEFHGALQGLWLAEVELRQADDEVIIPEWIGTEVTEDVRYSNAYLVEHGIPSV